MILRALVFSCITFGITFVVALLVALLIKVMANVIQRKPKATPNTAK